MPSRPWDLRARNHHIVEYETGPVPVMCPSSDVSIGLMDGLMGPSPKPRKSASVVAAAAAVTVSSPRARAATTGTQAAHMTAITALTLASRSPKISVTSLAGVSFTGESSTGDSDCISFADETDWEQIDLLRRIFRCFKRPGDDPQVISVEHLGMVLDFMGYQKSKAELELLKQEADKDGSGTMDFGEFVAMALQMGGVKSSWLERLAKAALSDPSQMTDKLSETRAALKKLFGYFSRGRGVISTTDAGQVLHVIGQHLTEEDINFLIAQADEDGSGTVDFDEFVQMVSELKKFADRADAAQGSKASSAPQLADQEILQDKVIDTGKALKAMIRDIDACQRQGDWGRLQLKPAKKDAERKQVKGISPETLASLRQPLTEEALAGATRPSLRRPSYDRHYRRSPLPSFSATFDGDVLSRKISVATVDSLAATSDCVSFADETDSEQIADFRRIFQCFERRVDGQPVISVDHLGEVLDFMGHQKSKAELALLKQEVDGDGSGTLDFGEFVAMALQIGGVKSSWLERLSKAVASNPSQMTDKLSETRAALKKLFGYFSKGTGLLATADAGQILKAIAQDLTEEDINSLIAQTDADGSNTVDFDEFVQMVGELRKSTSRTDHNAYGYEASMSLHQADPVIDSKMALKAMVRDIDASQRQSATPLRIKPASANQDTDGG